MMRTAAAIAAAVALMAGGASVSAQESRPAPGGGMQPGMMQPGMMPGGGMMHRGGGGMHEGGPMGGSMGGGMRGMGHLEHMMVHHPKEAARIMRFRADMLRAMSDVLAKHAAELDKAQ